MGQEQKPFEVITGVVVLGQEYSFTIFAEGKADLFAVSTAAKIIAKYAINANAEIRRLQGNELLHQSEIKLFQNATSQHCEEIAKLKQQLADAPSWGEWVDATVENLENPELDGGFYEFEWDNEATSLLIFTYDCTWLNEDGNAEEIFDDDDDIMPVRFRRLKYTPKPAREVEKKYGGDTLSK